MALYQENASYWSLKTIKCMSGFYQYTANDERPMCCQEKFFYGMLKR
jgi:hypothetical protein